MNEKDLKKDSETNWERLKTISDEEIDSSDIPPLDEQFFAEANLRVPQGKVPVLVNVDEEIADWYKNQGGNFQNLVNAALRDYAESHR
ncbi:MAG TPA: BrnA antitoxin family protein [Pyrinomonadaceae bacterium]|jgi:uncharacterized protein (DUF4415 family)|nr:BrnA antitoxin family protein [Pyrinomonadaceae bacterium]